MHALQGIGTSHGQGSWRWPGRAIAAHLNPPPLFIQEDGQGAPRGMLQLALEGLDGGGAAGKIVTKKEDSRRWMPFEQAQEIVLGLGTVES